MTTRNLISAELVQKLKAGDHAGALRTIANLNHFEAAEIMLHAGFSLQCIENTPQFWTAIQSKIALAANRRMDGWALRQGSDS